MSNDRNDDDDAALKAALKSDATRIAYRNAQKKADYKAPRLLMARVISDQEQVALTPYNIRLTRGTEAEADWAARDRMDVAQDDEDADGAVAGQIREAFLAMRGYGIPDPGAGDTDAYVVALWRAVAGTYVFDKGDFLATFGANDDTVFRHGVIGLEGFLYPKGQKRPLGELYVGEQPQQEG